MVSSKELSAHEEVNRLKNELKMQQSAHNQDMKVQKALYKIADAASSARDINAFYKKIHKIVGGLMYADNFFIAFHDKTTGMLRFPYYADASGDIAPDPVKFDEFRGVTTYLFRKMKPLRATGEEIKDLEAKGEFEQLGTLSEAGIGVPFIVDKNLEGVILVQSYDKGIGYDDSDLDVLVYVAQHIATSLERARAINAKRQRLAELEVINAVQKGLAKQIDFQGIIDLVGEKIGEIFDADTSNVAMYDAERDWTLNVYYVDRGERIPFPDGPAPRPSLGITVIDSRKPILAGTSDETEKFGALRMPRTGEREDKNESYLGVPILVDEKPIGNIAVQSYKQHAYNQDDLRLLTTLANAMSVALENARLFDETQQHIAELAVINAVQSALAAELDIEGIYDVVGDNIHEVFPDAQVVDILHYDPVTNLFHPRYVIERGKRFNVEPWAARGFRKVVIDTAQPLVINEDMEAMAQKYDNDWVVLGEFAKSWVGVPMMIGKEAIGVISLQHIDDENAFNRSDVRLLQTLANSLSIALENARLFDETQHLLEETKERNAELAVINSVQAGLASKLDIEFIYEMVGEQLHQIFPRFDISIGAYDSETDLITARFVIEHGKRIDIPPFNVENTGFIGKMINTRKTVLVNENLEEEQKMVGSTTVKGTSTPKSHVLTPLIIGDNVRGLVVLQDMKHEDAFSDSDVRLLETIANSMSVALENARLFDELKKSNHAITESLQRETATSDILRVTASSPADSTPVLDAIAQNAAQLCQANDVQVYEVDGEHLKQVTHFGPLPALQDGEAISLVPGLITGRSVLERRIIHVEDSRQISKKEYPDSVELLKRLKHRTAISVPMIRKGTAIGAIVVRRNEVKPFSEKQINLLATFADQAAIALENVRLFDETNRLLKETEERNSELAIINSVQASLASKLDFQGIINAVGDEICEIFPGQSVGINLIDYPNDLIRSMYIFENGKRYPNAEFKVGQGLTSIVIESGKPLVLNSENDLKLVNIEPVKPGDQGDPKSWLGVPVNLGKTILGVIVLEDWDRENAYPVETVNLVQTLASSLGVSLENARLFDETQRLLKETEERNTELAVINSIQEGLVSKLDIQSIFDLVGDRLSEIFNQHGIALYLLNPETLLADSMYVKERGVRLYPDPVAPGPIGRRAMETKEPFMLSTRAEFEAMGAITIPGTEPSLSGIYAPLIYHDTIIGALNIENSDREYAFTKSDIRLVTTIIGSMSVALENARLFDETQRLLVETEERNAELAVINSVQEGLVSKLEIQGIYDLVGDKIREIFKAQTVYIVAYDSVTEMRHFPYMNDQGERKYPEPRSLFGFTGRIIETGEPILITHDLEKYSKKVGSLPLGEDEPTRSWLGVPIFQGKLVSGVIVLEDSNEFVFDESDQRLLTTLSNSMSVALESARLFDETQHLLKETEQRAAELAIINSVQRGLASKLEMGAIYELVGDKISEITGSEIVLIDTWHLGKGVRRFEYSMEKGVKGTISEHSLTDLEKYILSKLKKGETLVWNEGMEERIEKLGHSHVVVGEMPLSVVVLPIKKTDANQDFITTISLQDSTREHAFDETDIRLVETLAGSMSVALDNARLFDETQRLLKETEEQYAELAVINSVQKGLASKLEINAIYDLVGDKIRETFSADTTALALYDKDNDLITAPYYSDGGKQLAPLSRLYGTGLAEHVIESGKPLLLNTSEEMEAVGSYNIPSPGSEKDLNETFLGVPLLRRGEVVGVISIQSYKQFAYGENDIRLLQTLANSMGVALENALLFNETNQQVAELETINTVSHALVTEPELGSLIQLIGEQVRQIFSADIAYLAMLDPITRTINFPYTFGEEFVPLKLGEGLTSKIIETGEPLLINRDIDKKRQELGTKLVGRESSSYLGVPIQVGKDTFGVISVQSLTREGIFDEDDVRLLNTIAANVGAAIRNAGLFDEIKSQKQYFESVIENSPAAIVLLDLEATVTGWNPAAENLFGYTETEAMGKNIDDLVANSNDLHAEAVRYSRQALGEKQIRKIVKRTRKDGTFVDVEVAGVPVVIDGVQSAFMAIYHDITELQRARQAAETANEAKSAFLATMSHEIRTPMNAVIGMSGLLLDTELTNEQQEFAETIRNSGDALLSIINDILDFSKIEAGKMNLEEQPFNLRECVESALDLVAASAFEKGLDLAYIIDDDVPVGIRSDVTRLRQVLLNLMSNAIKFTQEGEVVLTVSRQKRRKNELLFKIRDTGIGIKPDQMGRLFQSFSQADSTTSRKFGGTGLGLVISKRLTEMMGGEMSAESQGIPGEGSIFKFSIKAGSAEVPAKKTSYDAGKLQIALEGKHVLIVDDNATNRRILKLQTKKWGMQPRLTKSPKQALRWIKAGEPFDLAILDVQMPEMDGLILAGKIQELREASQLPIVLLTSLGNRELEDKLIDVAAFLAKPLKPSQLFDTLAGIFAKNLVSTKVKPLTAPSSTRDGIDPDMGKKKPLRILLAEDLLVNQKLALRLLNQLGYRADIASNGLEAVESIERQHYDAILMDVQMPEMDGLEATRQIRKRDSMQPYIIAMTANAMEGDREKCLEAGMDFYITKPIRVPELVTALKLVKIRKFKK